MSDTLAQPGLDSLSKSFEPAALEAHWGPEWGAARLWQCRLPRHGPACADATAPQQLRHPAAAAQRDRHAAHGPRLQPDHHGLPDALPPHDRASTPPGSPAPTTPASPPRSWSSASCRTRASAATTWAPRKNFVDKVWEWKEQVRQHHHHADAPHGRPAWTGAANTSPWTTSSAKWSPKPLCSLYQQGLIYRGKRLVNWDPVLQSAVSDLEVENEEEDGSPVAHRLPAGRRQRAA